MTNEDAAERAKKIPPKKRTPFGANWAKDFLASLEPDQSTPEKPQKPEEKPTTPDSNNLP